MDLAATLESFHRERNALFLGNDPLQFPRSYKEDQDRELMALLCALLAYGRADIICRNLAVLCERLGPSPARTIDQLSPESARELMGGFKHRFHGEEDLADLLIALRNIRSEHGTLYRLFNTGDYPSSPDITQGLERFSTTLLSHCSLHRKEAKGFSPLGHFFPRPSGGSACKRLCMFLRWVIRPDDGIDLGLWKDISTARLIIPIDTHTARISRLLGLTRRTTADWRMALEVTEALRAFDPSDPVRYDFALAHLGISDGCTGKISVACRTCVVRGACQAARTDRKIK